MSSLLPRKDLEEADNFIHKQEILVPLRSFHYIFLSPDKNLRYDSFIVEEKG
jgi:hypothetical protein